MNKQAASTTDVIAQTVDILRAKVPGVAFKEYTDKGHFTLGSMGTNKFPDLLEVVLAKDRMGQWPSM